MNVLLKEMANTIIANLANTQRNGLIHGKAGVALFFHKYAIFSGEDFYTQISDNIYRELSGNFKYAISPDVIDGSIGIAISFLKAGYLSFDKKRISDFIFKIKKEVYTYLDHTIIHEQGKIHPVFSCGILLLNLLQYYPDSVEEATIKKLEISIERIINREYVFKGVPLQSSYMLSILLYSIKMKPYGQIYSEFERILIKLLNKEIVNKEKSVENYILLSLKQEIDTIKLIDEKYNFWLDNCWWSVLYDMPIFTNLLKEEMKSLTETTMYNMYYDQMEINSKLSSIGIWIQNNYSIIN